MAETHGDTLSNTPEAAAAELVGSFRRLGELGPAYQVLSINSKDWATIIILESEEKLDYPIAKILADPDA
jgi:hypothetical protein